MMGIKRNSTEFDLLAIAAEALKDEFEVERNQWIGSRFEWINKLPSGTKGKLGKRLIYQWCALNGLAVGPSPDSEADMLINGHRAEIKLSMLWSGEIYKFQQLRDQNFEYAICIGISPFDAHCWVLSKKTLKKYVIGHLGQHTGSSGLETAWFSVDPKSPPVWLEGQSGSLKDALVVLKGLSHRK